MEFYRRYFLTANLFSLPSWKIGSKLTIVAGLPIVLTLGIGYVAVTKMDKLAHTQSWVDHTNKVLTESDRIVGAAVDMETGMRGFLLAGRDNFLEPFHSGEVIVFDTLSRLQKTVSDNPPQVERLQSAETVLREWRSEVAEQQIQLRRDIGDSKTINDLRDEVQKKAGKIFFDKFRGMIAEFIDAERVLLTERNDIMLDQLRSNRSDNSDLSESIQWVNQTNAVIQSAQNILEAAINMETGMRGFLLAGEEEFLEPLVKGQSIFEQLIEELAKTVEDNPAQVARLTEIDATILQWQATVIEPMITLRRDIGNAATMDDMADLIGEARGKLYFDEFRKLMAEFASIEQGLMETRQQGALETRAETKQMIIAAVILTILSGGIVSWIIGRDISGGISALSGSMREIAEGTLTAEITEQTRRDEVGQMARSLEVLNGALAEKQRNDEIAVARTREQERVMKDLSNRLSKLAHGDLTVEIHEAYPEGYEGLRHDFNHSIRNLSSAIVEVLGSAVNVSDGANAISNASNSLSLRTENQATTLEETASSIKDLTASVVTTANGAAAAQQTSSTVKNSVEAGQELVQRAVVAMSKIESSSRAIAEIISVIDDIAFQTNLLALNAGVEAARAGDAGRGFAVVASEVRGLALRCTDSASTIKGLIETSSGQVGNGVELVQKSGSALTEIVQGVDEIATLVNDIAIASDEQAIGLQAVNSGMTQLDRVAQNNAAMAEESTAAAMTLKSDAQSLLRTTSGFVTTGSKADLRNDASHTIKSSVVAA